ncbi:MAG: putative aminohydrolase SsnA, partial [Rudaea sp.]
PRVISNGAIYIEGDRIVEIGATRDLEARYPDADKLDAHGQLVMPGNICAHTHFYGAFARGMSLKPGPAPGNFVEILERLWWQIDRALTFEDCRYSALVCLADAIRSGTTTLIDHHASPNAVDGSLDVLAEAVEQAGVRSCLCYEVTDRNGEAGTEAGIRENVRFLNAQRQRARAGRTANHIRATFGLHASLTLSNRTLERCRAETDGLDSGFHVHVAEDAADQEDSIRRYGQRVVERFETFGILGPSTIAAHCVHVDDGEIERLKRTGTLVSHQPRSNMNNAVGVADVPGMMGKGLTVGLGNDGFSNNMFAEMKTAYLVHKLHRHDPRVMSADQVVEIAFANNRRIAARYWENAPGALKVGAPADVILLDYRPYTELTAGNFPWHLVFGIDGTHVTDTICAGRLLMKDRQLLTLDEEAIAARSRELADEVWRRVQEL